MIDILARLNRVKKTPKGWSACCPAHDDKHHSLSVAQGDDGRWLVQCHYAGCSVDDICEALKITVSDLFPDRPAAPKRPRARKKKVVNPSESSATVQQSGLTLADFSTAKGLPLDFLQRCGITEQDYDGAPAVRFPFYSPDGELLATHIRIALAGDRFRWRKSDRTNLYGLQRLAEAKKRGSVVICEGESDTLTLWLHNIPAVGLPGAVQWNETRDAGHFDDISEIIVLVEPDAGGEAVKKWLAQSMIRHRAKLLTLSGFKDVSALYLDSPKRFRDRWNVACLGAMPWTTIEAEANAAERAEAWNLCGDLAKQPDILASFGRELKRSGFAGDDTTARIIYLALTSRLLPRPVSIVIKGPSSGGKSFTLDKVLRFFPPAAYYALSALSERSLAYSNEPLKHRHMILYEAAGLGPFATYLMRSLLSEGCLRYETVEKTQRGLAPKLIEREGPTGLILTTTQTRLHPENETRMLSLSVVDTKAQTALILEEIAKQRPKNGTSLDPWQAFQTWLGCGSAETVIPYAGVLAALIPPVAVRLRRDFGMVLTLIRTHALLHQASRTKDEDGCIVATMADYAAIRELVVELVAQGLEATVKPEVRAIVQAVAAICPKSREDAEPATYPQLMKRLDLDKATISRRVREAIDGGYLKNLEERKRQPARLMLGDDLPDEVEILPTVERLLHCCAVSAGVNHNFSAEHDDDDPGWSFNLDDEPPGDEEARH